MQHPFPFAFEVASRLLLGVCCMVQLEAIDGWFILGLAHWGTEFWVHRKEHVREGSAEECAINVLVPGCTWGKDVIAPRAKEPLKFI